MNQTTDSATSEAPGARIRVLLVDDHPLMRRGIAGVLEEAPDIVVVAEADDGFQAQERYRELLPDVTLMDLAMPRCGGIEAIRAIRGADPQACIIAVTTYAGDGQIQRALEAGAAGYVLKSTLCVGVAELVRSAHAGRRVLAPDLAQRLTRSKPEQLTAREREVAAHLMEGMTSKEIGRALLISHRTVEIYRARLMRKYKASTTADLVHRLMAGA